MVDIADLERIGMLDREAQSISETLRILRMDGRIVAMVVATPPAEDGSGRGTQTATVDTRHIPHPPQMVDAIIGLLDDRLEAIGAEMSGMGVTGTAEARR